MDSSTCSWKNGKYLANIIDDSVGPCDEIIDSEARSKDEETKSIPTNFNEKNMTRKTQNFYILLAFLFITIALLIAVSIYCYLIKYCATQKNLLPFHVTSNKPREFLYRQMYYKNGK